MEASLSSESSKSESSNSKGPKPQVVQSDNLMRKVLLELTSLKHKVESITHVLRQASASSSSQIYMTNLCGSARPKPADI
jgi:hypothetical protein